LRSGSSLLAATLSLSFVLAGPAAGAQPERKPVRDADLGTKKSVAPDASLAGTLKAPTKKAEEKGPSLDFETFRYQIELEVSGKRREEMTDLRKLIKLGGSEAEMPGWLFRLAELHWEESQYFFFEANRKDDELIKLGPSAAPSQIEAVKQQKRDFEERTHSYQGQAISIYMDIIKRYPRYPRLDEVLFFLGENLSKQGKQKEALEVYKRLITRFSKSRYVPDAWMAFGEFYFNGADKANRNDSLANALKAYKRAATYTESTVYGYALYKQAWVYYNLGAWTEALDLFKAVIYFGDLPTSTIAADKKLALAREARKDYVRTYSHVGSPEGAMPEFKKVGGENGWWEMLKSLAGLYFEEGKDREAILVYHQLIKEKPLSPESLLFQSRIVTCAGRMQKKEFAVAQAHVFVKALKQIIDSGTVTDDKGKKLLDDAQNDAEATLRTLAVQYHNEYKKTREEKVAELATDVYQDYLAVFPESKHGYEMRFFYAELLFALEKYQRAGDEYSRVAQLDIKAVEARKANPALPKAGKYLQDSLENAVFSFDLVAKKFEESEKRPVADPKQRIPIPAAKQQFLDACQRYVKYASKGDKFVEVSYKAANIYYRYNYFAEATDLFTRIALDHPRHELAGFSTNLVLDAYNLLADWRNVNGWAKRFYANADLLKAHPQLKDDLARIIEQSSFKVIEEYEKGKSYRQAAEAYLAFVRDWPGSKLAPTGLYNASVDYASAHMLERAVEMRDRLMRQYPNDPLAPKAIMANGADYVAVADFEKAADAYERYFHWWKGAHPAAAAPKKLRRGKHPAPVAAAPQGEEDRKAERRAQDALYDAGVFREGLRQYQRALADRELFATTWPAATETPHVHLSIADLYAKQKAHGKEVKQLEEYQQQYAKDANEWLAIQNRLARIFEKTHNLSAERRAYEQALQYYKQHRSQAGERGMAVVAQAMYLELEPEFQKYDRITLDVKPKYLKAQLQVKLKKLVDLQKSYTSVVNLKQAEPAVCALYRIGLGYKRMAQTLYDAPVPKELRGNKAFVDEYKSQLAQLASGPEQKAVEGLEYAMVKSREYGVVNDCSHRATEILLKYKPDQYGVPAEGLPDVGGGAAADQRSGYGLLSALEPIPEATPAPEASSSRLAPLHTAAPQQGETERDPDLDDEPRVRKPAPKEAPVPIQQPSGKDEDLLP